MASFLEGVDLPRWLCLACPCAGLAVNVVTHILLVRLNRGAHFLRAIVLGFGVGVLTVVGLGFWLRSDLGRGNEGLALLFVVNPLAYGALSYCYANFANLGQSSIRIRLYAEIAEARGGAAIAELARRYDDRSLMALRLQRLVEGGDLIERDSRFFTGRRRLARIASIMRFAKTLLLGKESQFH